jgi:hypothetical protein
MMPQQLAEGKVERWGAKMLEYLARIYKDLYSSFLKTA